MNLLQYLYSLIVEKREKPLVLQMPITSRCNSQCVTCNIWKNKSQTDIDAEKLKRVLKDSFFSEVQTVGLNGGEFTLVPNFIEICKSVLTLPKIKSIVLISNGLFPKRLFEYLKQAHMLCGQKNVNLSFCLSVDGYGGVHDSVRGIKKGFFRTKYVLDEIRNNMNAYCDYMRIGCTISKYNIANIEETENFLKKYPFYVEYHLAVPNKRIGTFDNSDYSVFSDEKSRLLATEFFYVKFLRSPEGNDKRRYFAIYYNLLNRGHGRLTSCKYLRRDLTINENLNLYLCATASDAIGNLMEISASEMYSIGKMKLMERNISKYCNNCIHYSYYPLNLKGRFLYIREILSRKYCLKYYSLFSDKIFKIKPIFEYYYYYLYDILKYSYKLIWKLR